MTADRRIEVEAEVPGTPEQVWELISTGPGISAWFVPTEIDGDEIRTVHGPDEEIVGRVTASEAPRRFAFNADWAGRTLGTEFLVEARSGDSCVVRVVASGFGAGAEWDEQVDMVRRGWTWCLAALRLCASDFPGGHCSTVFATTETVGDRARIWSDLTRMLGLAGRAEGERTAAAAPDAPALDGRVELIDGETLLVRLDEPAPGYAFAMAYPVGDTVAVRLHATFFGDGAPAVAARELPAWEAWLARRFPAPDARVVELEIEVPATPEQVWQAIATGPGIECWFVPAEVDEREGGAITTHHGPWGASHGTVTAWQPPHRFAYQEHDWSEDADAPPWATELLVEARSGGSCVIRFASGIYSRGERWGDEIAPTESGWAQAMENLRVYLTHYAGQPVATLFAVGRVPGELEPARDELLDALGLRGATVGQRVDGAPGAPAFGGIVERVDDVAVGVHTEAPAPGLLGLAAWSFDGTVNLTVRAYLYGDGAAVAVEREEPAWRAWLGSRAALVESTMS